MASLHLRLSDGTTRHVPLVKRLTTVGRSTDNDIVVGDAAVAPSALHLRLDGDDLHAVALDAAFLHNGKKRNEARLSGQDVITLGGTELRLGAAVAKPSGAEPSLAPLDALRKLHDFSSSLMANHPIDHLLERLMDEVIEITGADKGFLILAEGDSLQVKVARNLERKAIDHAIERLSDSIVAKVVREKRALIVSDALHDREFAAAESVVDLKLSSVMCAPLLEKGELFGLLYLGNDRVAHLFREESLELLEIFAAQASLLLRNALLLNELRAGNEALRKELETSRYGEILGACTAMREIYRKIEKVAPADVSVLITGETGTGKEVIAREIHRRSSRRDGPFVAINCGAIPGELLESDLFGHVKGAFTGAIQTRIGKFQAAHGGTLFLDEIGEMPPHLQVKILRALQERVVTKVGENRAEAVDIRVIAATNQDVQAAIGRGTFRDDLYYRLAVVSLGLPPLRERGDDVLVLARYFLSRFTKELGSRVRGFSPAAAVALKRHGWPGNVRELENRVKKAVVLADRALLSPEDLELDTGSAEPVLPLTEAKEAFQREYINRILERNGGNRTKTARELGVDPRTIFRHLEAERGDGGEE
ncbi:sigma-54-dependent Fis family transcriptional regulator [Vulgatibacter incomptus]|uniref:Response regulatory protein n=1 Tax=Vulgatibacter incomptus TaxID=1391653 RepID=A0A0K1PAG0_9BACT|nr:sigma-54-dependent Fis family transcriptional regulator [Vulgatibacter incomptus]AKU90401.1 Response regulatory protein [Vulgatibacter incomptus]